MGSSRLYEFAKVLDVPVSYFFDDAVERASWPADVGPWPHGWPWRSGDAVQAGQGSADKRETLELVRA